MSPYSSLFTYMCMNMSHICFMLSYRQYEYLYRYMLLPTLTQLRCDQVCLLYLTCVLLPFIMYPEYASSEFLRNYVPLWVLFRKWGMKGVCLRKRGGKYYRRCIGKLIFLAFIEWISTFYLWVSIRNNTFKEKYSKLLYNLIILCHFKFGLILK